MDASAEGDGGSDEAAGIVQTPSVGEAMADLRTFLFEMVYPRALEEAGGEKINRLITQLMEYFLEHPEALPSPPTLVGGLDEGQAALVRAVADHVAGMTDRYAQRLYLELFMPRCWGDL